MQNDQLALYDDRIRKFMNNEQWEDVINSINQYPQKEQNSPFSLFIKSIALQQLNQLDQSNLLKKKAQQIMPDILQKVFQISQNSKSPIEIIFQCQYRKQKLQYDDIQKLCSEALNLYPNYTPLLFEIAYQFYKRKRYEMAFQYYEKLLVLNDASYLGLLGEGNVHYQTNNFNEALIFYDKAIKLYPLEKICYFKKCKILEKQEKFQQTILTYELLLIIDKEDEKIYSRRGDALCKLDDYEAAIYSYDKVLQKQFNNIDIQLKKGTYISIFSTCFNQQNEALKIIQQILNADQKNFKAYYEKGILLQELSKYSEAMHCFQQALKYNSDFYQAILQCGKTLYLKMVKKKVGTDIDIELAIEYFDKIIEDWPLEIQGYIYKCKLLILSNDCYQALQVINECQVIFSENLLLLKQKCKILLFADYYEEARQCCDLMIKLYPQSGLGYKKKALVLFHINKFSEALLMIERAISILPISSSLLYLKAIILSNLDNKTQALLLYDRAIKLNPRFYKAYINKSKCLVSQRKFQEALETVNILIGVFPQNPYAYSQKAVILIILGDKQQALLCCQQALDIDQNCRKALKIKQMIELNLC